MRGQPKGSLLFVVVIAEMLCMTAAFSTATVKMFRVPAISIARAACWNSRRGDKMSMHAAAAVTAGAQARNADRNAVAVIVGGSRGIGLAMVGSFYCTVHCNCA